MEDPFYGNGAGVQMQLPFAGQVHQTRDASAWYLTPYDLVDLARPVGAYCPVYGKAYRRLDRSSILTEFLLKR